jgi:hypothetical protein
MFFYKWQISGGERRGDGKKLLSSAPKMPSNFQIEDKFRGRSNLEMQSSLIKNPLQL